MKKTFRDLSETVIIAMYVIWDDEVATPFRKWKAEMNISSLFQHKDIVHRFSLNRGWILTLACVFLIGKFFPNQVAELPGVNWAFQFITGFIYLAFEVVHKLLQWLFCNGRFPGHWIIEEFKSLL